MLKKCFALLLALAILCASVIAVSATTYLLGDADDDWNVTILDATAIQRVLAGLKSDADGSIAKRCTIVGEKLSILDATAIQRHIAGFESGYPIGSKMGQDDDDYELPFIPG